MKSACSWTACLALVSAGLSVRAAGAITSEEHARIEQALPGKPLVQPLKPRRLLIFTLNVGYGGHPSIAYANEAFRLAGEKTGAFETEVSSDPAVFASESLRRFDAVFFNNTVGNCFTNADLRQNLVEFVMAGGGLMGVHGTTVAFTRWPGALEDWPEFGSMLGARGANHKDSDEHVWIKLDDSGNPITEAFNKSGFQYRDEFFRVHGPYSRDRVRVLLSIDTAKTDVNAGQPRGDCFRADNDYALAWVRSYGRGRVFYSTIAHNPYVFWDPTMLQFYFAAIQFALGDLPAPTTPSARLSPAVQAQERLGWRLGLEPEAYGNLTLFEAIEKSAALGLSYVGASNAQKVSRDINHSFGPELTVEEQSQLRSKLDSAGVRMLTCSVQKTPSNEEAWRNLFEFGRKMGVETFIASPQPEALDSIERLCEEYGMNLALSSRESGEAPVDWTPSRVLKSCKHRSKRVGACADLRAWLRSGIDPAQAARQLKDRLLTLQLHDLDVRNRHGVDVSWGTGAGGVVRFLEELSHLNAKPTMFAMAYDEPGSPGLDPFQSIRFFNQKTLELPVQPPVRSTEWPL